MIVKSLIPRKIEILVGSLALTVFGAAIVAGCVIMVTESVSLRLKVFGVIATLCTGGVYLCWIGVWHSQLGDGSGDGASNAPGAAQPHPCFPCGLD